MSKASLPKGTRDFTPTEMVRRNFIFSTVRKNFERFGFMPIETPAMEKLETLTGKYGEEGDQLIFKILNNGDYLSKANEEALQERDSKALSFSISKKALRYDLTVPFARFVVMNQASVAYPFKRYQIQPVWRGDRPGKGRYQEFYQCDVDIIGSDSLLNEVELVQIFDSVLSELKIPGFEIRLNNRKILSGIAEVANVGDKWVDMTTAIDKLDKIGWEGVSKELTERGIDDQATEKIREFLNIEGSMKEQLEKVDQMLANSEAGRKGVDELRTIIDYLEAVGLNSSNPVFDPTLARGLDYYTGTIFEVAVKDSGIGSICGGGRYDDLTGIFGLQGVSGVGISFGADRIYDVMEEMNLFPENMSTTTQLLFVNFGDAEAKFCMGLLKDLRSKGVNAEIFPESAKMKKQMKYADNKQIPFVAIVGSREMESGKIAVKNMTTGEQSEVPVEKLTDFLNQNINE
ncbi:histidine--tRNA ligase [Halocola ammonii]